MAAIVFNVAKGALVEKVRDGSANLIVLLLSTAEADATLRDYDTLAALLAGANTEVVHASYSRKTGITGTINVDDTNDLVDVSLPDQTWTALSGPDPVKVIVAYEESASDAGRIPLTAHDLSIVSDGSSLTLRFP